MDFEGGGDHRQDCQPDQNGVIQVDQQADNGGAVCHEVGGAHRRRSMLRSCPGGILANRANNSLTVMSWAAADVRKSA